MAFDESAHPRDDKGRFSETTEKLIAKSEPGSLRGWAKTREQRHDLAEHNKEFHGKYTAKSPMGLAGRGTWVAARDRFGPLAGKIAEARYSKEQQKELFPLGEKSLAEGTHFLKKSTGDPFGGDPIKEKDLDALVATHDAREAMDQAFKDVATRFPGVADYLKKNPLAEVQARRGYAEWQGAAPKLGEMDPGYEFQGKRGQYSSDASPSELRAEQKKVLGERAPGKFTAGEKPGDLVLALNEEYPVGHRSAEGKPDPFDTPDDLAHRMHVHESLDKLPFSVSNAGGSNRNASLATALHEIGHHVALGDVSKRVDERMRAVKAPSYARGSYQVGVLQGDIASENKGEQLRMMIFRNYYRDAEAHPEGPFTRYAGNAPQEWFAEAFAAFHLRPDWLKEKSPIAYKTVKRVMRMRGIQQPDPVRRGTPPLLKWASGTRKSETEV